VERSPWFRLLIGLWAVWFNAALLEAPGIHACAVHSRAATHGVAPVQMESHAHAMPDASPNMPNNEDCACTRLGVCCSAAAILPSGSAPIVVAHYTALVTRRLGNAVAAPNVARAHARPFVNGPPSLV